MTECGLTDTLRQRVELGDDVLVVTKFLDFHQKLLHDIEVHCTTTQVFVVYIMIS